MERVRFGIIGLGLMGREFASAAARWRHLPEIAVSPRIVSICSARLREENVAWFQSICPAVSQVTHDYREVLENPEVDAVYVAVPHNLHQEVYTAAIRAGKHLFGEKPFGIDLAANREITAAIAAHPEVFVRCTGQFPFAPAVQRIGEMIERDEFGSIIEVEAGFLHSSDLNPEKPINWKRRLSTNGEYGCMGDLGMHVCQVPLRAGWIPGDVRAILSNIITERPDGSGGRVPCETWDNAVLLTNAFDERGGSFPMALRMQRIAPGETNTWYLRISGTTASVRFSTKRINILERLRYVRGEQNWEQVDIGHRTVFPSITGAIFEFGFSDAILQMWAAFLYELVEGRPKSRFAACPNPTEVATSHRLFTAALESNRTGSVATV